MDPIRLIIELTLKLLSCRLIHWDTRWTLWCMVALRWFYVASFVTWIPGWHFNNLWTWAVQVMDLDHFGPGADRALLMRKVHCEAATFLTGGFQLFGPKLYNRIFKERHLHFNLCIQWSKDWLIDNGLTVNLNTVLDQWYVVISMLLSINCCGVYCIQCLTLTQAIFVSFDVWKC